MPKIIKKEEPRAKKGNKLHWVEKYLKERYVFRTNVIKNRVEYTPINIKKWVQVNENSIWREVNRAQDDYHFSMNFLCFLISAPEFSPPFHPIKDWIENLVEEKEKLPWRLEQKDPLSQLISFIKLKEKSLEESQRLYRALLSWFVSAIKCLYEANYAAKQAVVFMGAQSIGKTPFVKSLLPKNMQEFIKVNPHFHPQNKDSRISLTQNFVIIIDEIDDWLKAKENRDHNKTYMTETYVNERLPFARSSTTMNRICSFLGTCNTSEFLNDPTGSSRWVVFEIEGFVNCRESGEWVVQDFPIEQVWKFAYDQYKRGYDAELSFSELKNNEENNEKYKFNTAEYEILNQYFVPSKQGEEGAEFFNATGILEFLKERGHDVCKSPINLGKALKRANFERKSIKVRQKTHHGYWVKRVQEEMENAESPAQHKYRGVYELT